MLQAVIEIWSPVDSVPAVLQPRNAKPARRNRTQALMSNKREPNEAGEPATAPQGRRAELLAFFVLAVLIWPVLAVGVVGGYGFLVWMLQLAFGPPGPPA